LPALSRIIIPKDDPRPVLPGVFYIPDEALGGFLPSHTWE
jgi:hypothetical protein